MSVWSAYLYDSHTSVLLGEGIKQNWELCLSNYILNSIIHRAGFFQMWGVNLIVFQHPQERSKVTVLVTKVPGTRFQW